MDGTGNNRDRKVTGNKDDRRQGRPSSNKKLSAEQLEGLIFVYLVYYIFMNVKSNELHRDFKDTSGRRLKRVGLFNPVGDGGEDLRKALESLQPGDEKGPDTGRGRSILGMSRQRFYRMGYEESVHISSADKEGWKNKLGTGPEEFSFKDGGMVLGHTRGEWQDYFDTVFFSFEKEDDKEYRKKYKEEYIDKNPVSQSLKEMIISMDKYIRHPVYKIYYYVCHHSTYESKNNLQVAMDYLSKAGIVEWASVKDEEKERFQEILGKHYNYISMKRMVERMENES